MLAACAALTSESATMAPAASAILAAGEQHLIPVAGGAPFATRVRGHVTLIDFWASWCEGCRDGFAKLDRLARAYPKLVVLGVDVGEDVEPIERFLANLKLSYPQYRDPALSFADSVGSRSLPSLVLLDRDTNVVAREEGLTPELLAKIKALLADQGSHVGR